jgi:TonB family protein
LGIHPVTGPPPADLAGNRRGTFAATPEGKAGAAGTPDISADVGGNGAGGRGKGRDGGAGSGTAATGLPPGLMVGAGPKAGSAVASGPAGSGPGAAGDPSAGNSNGSLVADNRPMRVTVNPEKTLPNDPSAAIAREVFGNRRSYPMIENMPNLNSRGGTWIIRFAEAKPIEDGHFTAPSSIRKVDPGYPQELIRQNVNGTLTLYAVVRSDGTVGNVRVINSPDERLDRYACAAFERWQFRPATMNGKPIDVEAVVIIPFRTGRGF